MNKKKDIITTELDKTEKLILLDKYTTAQHKVKFINELKTGLGEELKKNPSKANFIKKTRFERFVIILKKIFTKF